MRIIAKLLKPLLLLTCGRGCIWKQPCWEMAPFSVWAPSCLLLAHCGLWREGRCSKLLCAARLTVGMRKMVVQEAEDDVLCDWRGWSLCNLHCTQASLLLPLPLEQTCLVFETTAACTNACTCYKSYRLSINISLSPTKNIEHVVIKQSHLKIILILHYTSYFYNHFNKLHVKLQ